MLEVVKLPTNLGHQIHVASSGKESGNMSITYEPEEMQQIVFENRIRLYGHVGLSATEVVRVWNDDLNNIYDLSQNSNPPLTETGGLRCDGLLTTELGQGLAMVPADCVPMVVYAQTKQLIGLIHVGRSNAQANIHLAALNIFTGRYGIKTKDIGIYLGPSIHKKSYRYEWFDPALATDPKLSGYFEHRDGSHYLDLLGLVRDDLRNFGLTSRQIEESPSDTGSDPTYFSHRRSQLTGESMGRNGIVAVMLKK